MFNWFKNRRRRNILREPWPSTWNSILEGNVGLYKGLSTVDKTKLKAITRIIVSEKHWEAHDGLVMSDEIKVTIAGTARASAHFGRVRQNGGLALLGCVC